MLWRARLVTVFWTIRPENTLSDEETALKKREKKQATEGGKPAAAGEFKGQNSPTRGGVTETQKANLYEPKYVL